MATKSYNTLQPKHWKALELIEENSLPFLEISRITGVDNGFLNDCYRGKPEGWGNLGDLFIRELTKIEERQGKKIKKLLKSVRETALEEMLGFLQRERSKKRPDQKQISEVCKIMTSMAKSSPNIEIGAFSYTQGLSAEDLVNEFRRLSTTARDSLVGKGVSRVKPGGSREILESSQRGNPLPEDETAPVLRSESEAGEVS